MTPARIGVLGAGSWGTALAVHLARTGHDVRLWARDPALAADDGARRARIRPTCPASTLPPALTPTARHARRARWRAVRRDRRAVARRARGGARRPTPHLPRGVRDRQRRRRGSKTARCCACREVLRAGVAGRRRRRRAVRAELRDRAGARAADGGGRGRRLDRRSVEIGAGGLPIAGACGSTAAATSSASSSAAR